MKLRRILASSAAAALAATGLVACSDSGSEGGDAAADGPIRIGTTDASQQAWAVFEEVAAEDGIELQIENFSDYNTPNQALSQDQIDVNKFQHLKFLAEYNVGAGDDLVAIGATEIYPLDLFWQGHDSLDGIEGESVAIPNDPSNQGRAINVLVQAGLVTLREEGLVTPTPADIDEEASQVSVTPVDAAQTPAAYGEGRPAIINNSWLDRAGIDPESAVFHDDPNSEQAEPYINVFVTRAEDADDPRLNRLVELWHSDEVMAAVAEDSQNTAIEVERTREELAEILERLEEAERNQG
ncbi:MetQ/NlpA family ABC transporter substrate-binding protein [Corynebacterium halotolerans]|uniref:Methionine ABC transporter substrate-binding protein n=1 Tax=Corynebacterium halotolerans YIM 70093 = DSM 44683 TaxID=1121362 RepID=M1MV82_9CORY|nr:MetQ/NlpA family ABC transporter substrate-binding protein [Corynebacterium halotolerans]AGF71629.1 hypothetical protein A605_03075 [Corynebacterium halotolerans YIM 70093 = DSM 44683]